MDLAPVMSGKLKDDTTVGAAVGALEAPTPQRDPTNTDSLKPDHSQPYLSSPLLSAFRPSYDGNLSVYSADNENERQRVRLLSPSGHQITSRTSVPPQAWRTKWSRLWTSNKGLVYVLIAQLFGALMNVTTRLLETSEHRMNAFQIMFARMGITLVLGSIYMWWAAVPDFPLGVKEVRGLLLARSFGGFFGLFGIYYSLQYLPLAEATVITFLAPIAACWACSILIHEPFTRAEQLAGAVSLVGVVLIARPGSIFQSSNKNGPVASGVGDSIPVTNATATSIQPIPSDTVSPRQRLIAVAVALVGVLGAACAYTTIRWIGKRTHPLVSVNYFAAWTTFVATTVLLFVPGMDFKLPASATQWGHLVFLGVCGFIMQLMLTAGLAHEKSSRATNMVYTQMLFALAFDKIIFDTTPGALSIVGSSLILGGALYVAVQSDPSKKTIKNRQLQQSEEEQGLVAGDELELNDDTNDGRAPSREVQEVQLRAIRV